MPTGRRSSTRSRGATPAGGERSRWTTPEIGAQAQVFDYPLLGAAFDGHDQRAELMFGVADRDHAHLTRGIAGVTRIDVLRHTGGGDVALRIGHGAGQTILTFTSG
jgi:hypothetical protein